MEFTIFKGGKDAYLLGGHPGFILIEADGITVAKIYYGEGEAVKTEADARELISLICIFLNQKHTA